LGDINGDRKIDKNDLKYIENSFGFKAGESGYNDKADLNEDGIINVLDLMIVAKNLS
jgi:Ca2+-binding EF-hand superfamily protein